MNLNPLTPTHPPTHTDHNIPIILNLSSHSTKTILICAFLFIWIKCNTKDKLIMKTRAPIVHKGTFSS